MSDGTKNLIPMSKRTKEEQRQIAIKGGKASGIKRNEIKQNEMLLQTLLTTKVNNKKFNEIMDSYGIKPNNQTYQMLLVCGLYNSAINGNVNAYDRINEMINTIQLNTTNYIINLIEIIKNTDLSNCNGDYSKLDLDSKTIELIKVISDKTMTSTTLTLINALKDRSNNLDHIDIDTDITDIDDVDVLKSIIMEQRQQIKNNVLWNTKKGTYPNYAPCKLKKSN